jgi:hypothetical protein
MTAATHTAPPPAAKRDKHSRETRRQIITNVSTTRARGADGEEERATVARAPQDVAGDVFSRVGPIYGLGNRGIFTPDADDVRMLADDSAVFAWLKSRAMVHWATRAKRGGNPVTRAEFVAHLRASPAERFDDIATLPHEPRVDGTFYTRPALPPPNPARLAEFLDHLNPETNADRALLEAALLTPGWGGPCGARPAFVLASDHGRGSGKTLTAETIAAVWGGAIGCDIATRDGIDRLRQRLLHDATAARRVALMDNLKGTTSSAEIESLITAGEIQGHKLYSGDASRPNRLTWFVTANRPHMSRDLADRSVVIKIGRPRREDFASWASAFVDQHRLEIVATIITRLAGPPVCSIPADCRDRWRGWQEAVLSRVQGGNASASEIIARRPAVDADAEDWCEIEAEITALIRAAGHDPDVETVAMPLSALAARLCETTGIRFTPKGLASKLGEFVGIDGADQFVRNPHKGHGRTWLWQPANAPHRGRIEYPDWAQIDARTLERRNRWA